MSNFGGNKGGPWAAGRPQGAQGANLNPNLFPGAQLAGLGQFGINAQGAPFAGLGAGVLNMGAFQQQMGGISTTINQSLGARQPSHTALASQQGGGGPHMAVAAAMHQQQHNANAAAVVAAQAQQKNQRAFVGTVTKLQDNYGFVDDDVFFQIGVVRGTVPHVGDRVMVEANYNPSMPFKWNAFRIQLLPSHDQSSGGRHAGPTGAAGGGGGDNRWGAGSHQQAPPPQQAHAMPPQQHNEPYGVPMRRQDSRDQPYGRARDSPPRSHRVDRRSPLPPARRPSPTIRRPPSPQAIDPPTMAPKRTRQVAASPSPTRHGSVMSRDSHRDRHRDKSNRDRDRSPKKARRESPRESRSPSRQRHHAQGGSAQRGGSQLQQHGHRSGATRYSVHTPKVVSDCATLGYSDVRRRYSNMYIPSDFFDSLHHWHGTFPVGRRPFNLDVPPVRFHILGKSTDPLMEGGRGDYPLDPPDVDYTYSAKVMLLCAPQLKELYKSVIGMNVDGTIDEESELTSTGRLINFLVGTRGGKSSELLPIGGPWSPSLDGPNPAAEPATLIRTAVRCARQIAGIDLSMCTTWYKFVEVRYRRSVDTASAAAKSDSSSAAAASAPAQDSGSSSSANGTGAGAAAGASRVDTVVIFVPDVWSAMPADQAHFEAAKTQLLQQLQSKLAALDRPPTPEPEPEPEPAAEPPAAQVEATAPQETAAEGGTPAATEKADVSGLEDTSMLEDGDEAPDDLPKPTPHDQLDVQTMKVTDLRRELEARGLDKRGLKAALCERLAAALDKERADTSSVQHTGGATDAVADGTGEKQDTPAEQEKKDEPMETSAPTTDETPATAAIAPAAAADTAAAGDAAATGEAQPSDATADKGMEDDECRVIDEIHNEPPEPTLTDKEKEIQEKEKQKELERLEKEKQKQKEKEEKERKEKKAQLEKDYKLPDNLQPCIFVHPHPAAKSGRFDCRLASLHSLLDYRADDSNKEHSFELSLFAEAFDELITRDRAFDVYKVLCTAPDREAEKVLLEERKQQALQAEQQAQAEQQQNDDEKDGAAADGAAAEANGVVKDPAATIGEAEKVTAKKEKDRKRGNVSRPDKEKTERKLSVCRRQGELYSWVYFDRTMCGYVLEKDAEEIVHSLGLRLSRSQVTRCVRRISSADRVYYRKYTDAVVLKESTAVKSEPLPLAELDAEATEAIINGNKCAKAEGDMSDEQSMEVCKSEPSSVTYQGALIDIAQIVNRSQQLESGLREGERAVAVLDKDLKTTRAERDRLTKRKKVLDDELEKTKKRLHDTERQLKTTTDDMSAARAALLDCRKHADRQIAAVEKIIPPKKKEPKKEIEKKSVEVQADDKIDTPQSATGSGDSADKKAAAGAEQQNGDVVVLSDKGEPAADPSAPPAKKLREGGEETCAAGVDNEKAAPTEAVNVSGGEKKDGPEKAQANDLQIKE